MAGQSLDQQRKKIDDIDSKILDLLNARARVAKEIGRIKERNGDNVFALNREREILTRLAQQSDGPLPIESIEDIFQAIFTAHRSLQKRLRVAFFGPEGTFTHQLAVKHFGRGCEYIPLPTIADVFSEVEKNRADYGVVPIENSTEGVVNHTLDLFVDSSLVIAAEREEPISHYLFSTSGDIKKIKTVYSHPQALAQCRRWLEAHLPNVPTHEAASTSDAAVQASLDASVASIGSVAAGEIYHLKPVAMKIEDSPNNTTRFFVIGRTVAPATGKDKTSLVFSVKDKVGALFEILNFFKKSNINMTKIESRPTKKKAWEYLFFVDIAGHQSDKRVQKALVALRRKCTFLKILGSYPYGA